MHTVEMPVRKHGIPDKEGSCCHERRPSSNKLNQAHPDDLTRGSLLLGTNLLYVAVLDEAWSHLLPAVIGHLITTDVP